MFSGRSTLSATFFMHNVKLGSLRAVVSVKVLQFCHKPSGSRFNSFIVPNIVLMDPRRTDQPKSLWEGPMPSVLSRQSEREATRFCSLA
jgi:hypothetical protein